MASPKKITLLEAVEALSAENVQVWNAWRDEGAEFPAICNAYLSGKTLKKIDFSELTFLRTSFDGCQLHDADFRGATLNACEMKNSQLQKAKFDDATITCDFENADLEGASFVGSAYPYPTEMDGSALPTSFKSAKLAGAIFTGCVLRYVNFSGARYNLTTNFEKCDLRDTVFDHCSGNANFAFAKLRNASLRRCNFDHAALYGADLRDTTVDAGTRFAFAKVDNCKIDRLTLASLENNGNMTVGQLSVMDIESAVVTLRASYSGYMQWIHVTALIAFLYPYVWFLLLRWIEADISGVQEEHSITMLEALWNYIWTGGKNWGTNVPFSWRTFPLFVYMFAYNVLRFVLLAKTKQIELRELITGIPQRFSFAGAWGILYSITKWGFFINIAAALGHTIVFLLKRVPIAETVASLNLS